MAINIGENTDGDVTYKNPPVDRTLFPNIKYGATPEEIQEAVDAWLDDHPEATTTVEDGSILPVKLDSTNDATDGYVLSYNATAEKFEWYDIGGDYNQLSADMETKANVDGSYDNMTVGNAKQLVATVGITDKTPYNFRTSGGSVDIGDREVDKVVGGTVAWNQLVADSNLRATATINDLTVTHNGDGTLTLNGSVTDAYADLGNSTLKPNFIAGHKYLFLVPPAPENCNILFTLYGDPPAIKNENINRSMVLNCQNTKSEIVYPRFGRVTTGATVTVTNYTYYFNIFDLTQMFGSTIADYVYTLETATAGAGVAWFRKLFPKPYYAYDAGSLQSVQTSEHKMVGFNQWDEVAEVGGINSTTGQTETASDRIRSKNYIKLLPSTAYYAQVGEMPSNNFRMYFYDANKNFIGVGSWQYSGTFTTPSGAYYGKFVKTGVTTYANDICINLHWDGERDGEYEPYVEYTYPLDDSLTLRGIPKLDSGNNLYYDGDEYSADGTVNRTWAEMNMGSLAWSYQESTGRFIGYISNIDKPSAGTVLGNIICDKYVTVTNLQTQTIDKTIAVSQYGDIAVKDTSYGSDAVAFKTGVTGNKLTYKLATPTTESASPFTNPQIVDDFGTEEYVDAGVTASTPTRDVAIPVGHETVYQANLRAKLEMAPNSPDGDGDYIVRQTNGENEYVLLEEELPSAPSSDGTYSLKVTVSGSSKTLSWVSDT